MSSIEVSTNAPPAERMVKFFAKIGGLVGLFTFGAFHVAFFILPLAMAIGLRSTEKRGWLPPRKDGARSRPGLGLLVAAPLSLLLAEYPTIYLLLIFWSVVLSPALLSIKSNPHSGHDPVMLVVGAFCLATLVAIYSGLQALALKRFAGNWPGSLFWQLFACTGGVIVGAFLVSTKFIWETNVWRFLTHNWFLLPWWLVCPYAFSRMGAVFGKWLTNPSR